MAQFTILTQAEVASLCDQFGLGTLLTVQPIAAGTINSNYRVETERGRYFLRVNEGKTEAEVQFEFDVLSHLVAGGVATAEPLAAGDGRHYAGHDGQFVSVFAWQDGTHSDSKSISESECTAVGGALAQLHLAGADMPCTNPGRYTLDAIRQEYEAFAASTDPELADAIAVLAEEFAWLDTNEAERRRQPAGLIHADLFPDNVLLRDQRVVALLDFEQACAGSYCYDLAVCANAWCFADALVPNRVSALLAGYQSVKPLSAAELRCLRIDVRAAAVRFLVTRIRDIYLPESHGTASGAPGKDFRRFLMRLRTWQRQPPSWLADLSAASRRS